MTYLSKAQQRNIRVYREYYSKFAEDYEERTREEAKITAETMTEWINLSSLKILDFGVGTGSVWQHLYEKGIGNIQVVGLDVAPGMLKLAKKKGIPWLRVFEKPVEDSEYENCFDLVCAHGLLKHCADPTIIVKKAHRALVNNGQFFVEDLSIQDDVLKILKRLTEKIKGYIKPSKRKTSFYVPDKELIRQIENVGFRLQKFREFSYALTFRSFEHIRSFLTEKMMFGLYTYKTIPLEHRKNCDKIFMQTIKGALEKPVLKRRTFICLFQKASY
jgi:SAM-dependent methyltransferase